MKIASMCRLVCVPVILCMVSAMPMVVRAQDDGVNGPPKVLVVVREMTKPGRGGMMHERTEGAYIQALKANHVDDHYLAMTSLSGPDRALFFSGYSSFGDWEASVKAMDKNPAGAAAMDHANVADGDLLSETANSAWRREDDLSMNERGLHGDRYMEIEQFKIKPGHTADWEELVKLVKGAYEKGIPDASWVTYEQVFGTAGDGYIVIIPLKSLAEVDEHHMRGKAFMDAMGKDGMKKLDELTAASVESEQTNLFMFSPKMSNPPEQWVKDEPDFWGTKKMMPMKKDEKKDAMKPM
jgi:hypothetical protein